MIQSNEIPKSPNSPNILADRSEVRLSRQSTFILRGFQGWIKTSTVGSDSTCMVRNNSRGFSQQSKAASHEIGILGEIVAPAENSPTPWSKT